MQRPITPKWLLRQANELAYRDQQTAGQPRNANLRRAVSSAYYALFHHVTLSASIALLPTCPQEDHWRLVRHFQHHAVRQVCEWIVGPSNPPDRVRDAMLRLRQNAAFLDSTLAFLTLQESRHLADYDHLADFSKAEVLTLIDSAEDAIDKLTMSAGCPDHHRFVAHLALKSRMQ